MSSDVDIIGARTLRDLRSESLDAFGPRSSRPWLAVDLDGIDPTDDDFALWLGALPCPVVGLRREGQRAGLDQACDAIVERPEALVSIAATIEASPIAAMTFVQLLRLIEGLRPDQALTAESLAYGVLQTGPEFGGWLRQAKPVAGAGEPGPAVLIDRRDGDLHLTLNRPGNRNALSLEMRDALVEALDIARLDEEVRTVTLRGAGRCFSVGGDLSEFGLAPDPATAHWVRSVRSPARAMMAVGHRLTVQVQGACIGAGVELPAFAAEVIAAPDAFFQLPELKMGLLPGSGGCVSLSRRIGRQRTALLGLTGRRITASTALAWGLVDRIGG